MDLAAVNAFGLGHSPERCPESSGAAIICDELGTASKMALKGEDIIRRTSRSTRFERA